MCDARMCGIVKVWICTRSWMSWRLASTRCAVASWKSSSMSSPMRSAPRSPYPRGSPVLTASSIWRCAAEASSLVRCLTPPARGCWCARRAVTVWSCSRRSSAHGRSGAALRANRPFVAASALGTCCVSCVPAGSTLPLTQTVVTTGDHRRGLCGPRRCRPQRCGRRL